MKRLLIHVGHGKTGSSYLQSVFALNRDFLSSNKIFYPEHQSLEKASAGGVSSGNGDLVFGSCLPNRGEDAIFLSNELLFRGLLIDQRLIDLSRDYNLEIVIYTRNVVEHSVSKWAQGVKGGGVYLDVNTFLTSASNDVLTTLMKWINKSKEIGFDLSIRNYSICRSRLVEDFFENFLKVDVGDYPLKLPPNRIVNRSLTNSEYEIQRLFNAAFGKDSSSYISEYLIEKFPGQSALKIKIDAKTFEYLERENSAIVREINKTLTEEQRLEIGFRDEWVASSPVSNMRNDVLQSLGENVVNSLRLLSDNEIECIENLSTIFAETHNDWESANALINIAKRHRPNQRFFATKPLSLSVKSEISHRRSLGQNGVRRARSIVGRSGALVTKLRLLFTQKVKSMFRAR